MTHDATDSDTLVLGIVEEARSSYPDQGFTRLPAYPLTHDAAMETESSGIKSSSVPAGF